MGQEVSKKGQEGENGFTFATDEGEHPRVTRRHPQHVRIGFGFTFVTDEGECLHVSLGIPQHVRIGFGSLLPPD